MGTGTPIRRLLEHLIEDGLEDYITVRRQAGKSWRLISLDIRDEYDVDVTHETLRGWFPDVRRGRAA